MAMATNVKGAARSGAAAKVATLDAAAQAKQAAWQWPSFAGVGELGVVEPQTGRFSQGSRRAAAILAA